MNDRVVLFISENRELRVQRVDGSFDFLTLNRKSFGMSCVKKMTYVFFKLAIRRTRNSQAMLLTSRRHITRKLGRSIRYEITMVTETHESRDFSATFST